MIRTVQQTGGHLASSLGAVEIAIALHRVMDSPYDRIVWDTGHQAYAHKLLTGRWPPSAACVRWMASVASHAGPRVSTCSMVATPGRGSASPPAWPPLGTSCRRMIRAADAADRGLRR